MKPLIVISDGFDSDLFEQLRANLNLEVYPKNKLSQNELSDLLPKVEGLVIRSATKPDPKLIDCAPNLKYIIRAGEGTDNIDKAYCTTKGIKVSNTPGANSNSAAEHAISLMFTLLRKTAHAHQSMSEGKWEKALFSGREISDKTIGFIGFGNIGQIVARRLSGFEPKVLFFDPVIEESPLPYAHKVDNLTQLLQKSDIVTIHAPLIEQTKNLLTYDLITQMPAHAVLIHAARGKIVNEEDLIKALQENKISGAALDVFETEPLPSDSPLRSLPNVVLTPHLGASTAEAQIRVGKMVINQLNEFFINNNLLNEVKT